MPDQKLGFVLLTNVSASPIGAFAMTTIWKGFLGDPKATETTTAGAASDPKKEVGTYKIDGAPVNFEVTIKDGKLTLTVPGQPPYPLENVSGRRYKLGDPAPPGFFATFRPVKDKQGQTELLVEQPQGNVVAAKIPSPSLPVGAQVVTDRATAGSSLISSDELITKMIEAQGGEANIRKHKSSVTTIELDLESQGMKGQGTLFARAPNLNASEMTL